MNTMNTYSKAICMFLGCIIAVNSLCQDKSFEPTLESLEANYQFPEWFQDAKFGIWAHWGPQSVARMGDMYAKRLYYPDFPHRKYHETHYGHPSEVGYKDIIPDWKAENFDPESLMKLYKKAGAKYFVTMGAHVDNFYLWNSKFHRWNSVKMGPKKDIVKMWQDAAKKEGLPFGISEHLGASYNWFQSSHGADKTGPYAGIPYDGANPEYQDLYHDKSAPDDNDWYTTDVKRHQNWYKAVSEIIDLYHPDLLYSDGGLAFEGVGIQMIADYYNDNLKHNNGELTAIYTCKSGTPEPYWVLDFERGKFNGISKYPWQTDTSVGDWFYDMNRQYMNSTQVLHILVDIVSKNGNLLLNIPQTPEGDLDGELVDLLERIGIWFEDNGEGIYGTRPWKIYGEGPSTEGERESGSHGGTKEFERIPLTNKDFRFTTKNGNIYAFCMMHAKEEYIIKNMSSGSQYLDKPIKEITLLGSKEKLNWEQTEQGLVIKSIENMPQYNTVAFKISF